jgi:hypothetical protein
VNKETKSWLGTLIKVLLCVIPFLMLDGNLCLFKRVLGLPCPGCGLTRAYLSLLRFDLGNAFFYHPLFIIPLGIGLIILLRHRPVFKTLYHNNYIWGLIGILFFSVWIVRMFLLFPETPPLDYDSRALLPTLIRLISRLWHN